MADMMTMLGRDEKLHLLLSGCNRHSPLEDIVTLDSGSWALERRVEKGRGRIHLFAVCLSGPLHRQDVPKQALRKKDTPDDAFSIDPTHVSTSICMQFVPSFPLLPNPCEVLRLLRVRRGLL